MRRPLNIIYSLLILTVILGFNPGACSKACRVASRTAGEHAGQEERLVAKGAEKAAEHSDEASKARSAAPEVGRTEQSASQENKFFTNTDGTYSYGDHTYQQFDDIPFHAADQVYMERGLSSDEAAYLMKRGVKFVYNIPSYFAQRDRHFRVLYLISDDVGTVKQLYNLDDDYAQKLINISTPLVNNQSIIKCASLDEMLKKQHDVLGDGEVPICIFHNNLDAQDIQKFDPRTNMITCNSFQVNPQSYLTSTSYLDVESVIAGVNESYLSEDLQTFYANFSNVYYNGILKNYQQVSLVYLSAAAGVSAGIGAYVYYNKSEL